MNHKKVFIGIFLLLLTALSFLSIVSAGDLRELLRDDVTNITVTVTQDESWVDFVFNPENAAFDYQQISIQNKDVGSIHINNIQLSFNISKILSDINGRIEIKENSDVLQFNELNITGTGFINIISFETNKSFNAYGILDTHDFIQRVVDGLTEPNLNISNLTAVNEHLANNPLSRTSDRNIIFTKTGNNYKIWNNKGWGDLSGNRKTEITNKIENDITEVLNINELFEENVVPFLEENGLASSLFDLNTNYTIEVNLSTIELVDGTYSVPITVSNGFDQVDKNITLVLQGFPNPPSTGGGGRARDSRDILPLEPFIPSVSATPEPTPTPIEATPAAPTPGFFGTITGAVIGALGTGGSIIVIVFIILIVVLAILAATQSRLERGKGKKLNEKSDKNEI